MNKKNFQNARKWIPVVFIIVVVCIVVFYKLHKEVETDNLDKNITISKESWVYETVWSEYDKNGFMIEDKNKVPVDLIITVSVYDKNGGYSYDDKIAVNAVAPQSSFFFEKEYGTKVERVELTEYECKKSGYQALKGDEIKVSTDNSETDVLISAKNNSSKDTSGCICTVVFYDENDKILNAETIEMHNGKIPSGKTVTEEVDNPLTLNYDSIKIFTNAYTN